MGHTARWRPLGGDGILTTNNQQQPQQQVEMRISSSTALRSFFFRPLLIVQCVCVRSVPSALAVHLVQLWVNARAHGWCVKNVLFFVEMVT